MFSQGYILIIVLLGVNCFIPGQCTYCKSSHLIGCVDKIVSLYICRLSMLNLWVGWVGICWNLQCAAANMVLRMRSLYIMLTVLTPLPPMLSAVYLTLTLFKFD